MKSIKIPGLIIFLAMASLVSCNNEKEKGVTDEGKNGKEDVVAKNIETSRTFYPMFEKGDWTGIEKIVDPNFQDHNAMMAPGTPSNRDSLMKYLKITREAFPDLKFDIMHVAGSDDIVFVHYRFTGTNTGPFLGMPATNKKVDYNGVDMIRVKDGVAVEHWVYSDNLTYMKQMGMLPDK